MALPFIAVGAGILAFITWGKDVFGENTFNKLLKGLIISILVIGAYLAYKAYEAYSETKEKVEDSYEYVTEGLGNILDDLIEAGERGAEWIGESKIAQTEAIKKLDPYLGLKSGISETSLEAKQYALGQKWRKDFLNSPSYIIEGTKENIKNFTDKLKFW